MDCGTFITEKLAGGLWHATKPEYFKRIVADGFIQVEPDLPDSERWGASQGPDLYPYVRHIGGFSLFDFPAHFDVDAYRRRCPISSIDELIPFRRVIGGAVWIQIDREATRRSVIGGVETWKRLEAEGAYRHRLMPYIEAAHIGDMPLSSAVAAYLVGAGDEDWRQVYPNML
ncbi:hypothetical protein [Shinella fusca]|uniref:Uncharacterized protein n=1 Tax=Shinella fusca TaxID=544480 RepID=A0A7W7YT50_9HYPH|nr:hypothetical protein [Shinella fusca]MBB5041890.1 hypothetical protein [Shinella fusca]